jgi:hypothetical protein
MACSILLIAAAAAVAQAAVITVYKDSACATLAGPTNYARGFAFTDRCMPVMGYMAFALDKCSPTSLTVRVIAGQEPLFGYPSDPIPCGQAYVAGVKYMSVLAPVGTCTSIGYLGYIKVTDATCTFPTTNSPIVGQYYANAACPARDGDGWIALTPADTCVSNMAGSSFLSASKLSGSTPNIAFSIFSDAACLAPLSTTTTLATQGVCNSMTAGSIRAFQPAVYTPVVPPTPTASAKKFLYRRFVDNLCMKEASGSFTLPIEGVCNAFPGTSYFATSSISEAASDTETVRFYTTDLCEGIPVSESVFKVEATCTEVPNSSPNQYWFTTVIVNPPASSATSTAVAAVAALLIAVAAAAAGLRV